MALVVLECPQCSWQVTCSIEQIVERLRRVGALRRATHPPDDLVLELLYNHLPELTCDKCQQKGLVLSEDEEEGDWQQAVVCEVCRQPIPPERLEVFPNARCCVNCQNSADRGELAEEPDFCPRCGSLVELRVSRAGGLTRYKRFCTGDPPCRL